MTSLSWQQTLSAMDVDDIVSLLAAAERADGTGPVSEDVRLALRPGLRIGAGRHLLAVSAAADTSGPNVPDTPGDQNAADTSTMPGRVPAGRIIGYAHLGGVDQARQAEVVVHPDHRGRGVGTALVGGLTEALAAPSSRLDIWAHGDLPAAAALATRLTFTRTRVLLQLRRPLAAGTPLPDPRLPAGVTVRTFVPDQDDRAWLAVNAAAFADHPEQGRWTLDDLARRRAEPWFDPRGFFLAEHDGALVGFHWTKVHETDQTPPRNAQPGPIGEVYVVGVLPGAGGAGLGRALTLIGLRHLQAEGLDSVLLYVDEDNVRAVRMYTGLGFITYVRDVSYHWERPSTG
ncbi:acetyltransferase [Frankia casuarinae]|uniref:Mycothiol acetyltransferase n=1 Tax=Frankia casuarinae (strain DSM 45818 / CECT 9043 / HFP020203 / CcI3) TaxID=106370 RepID=MSHD_FRACC|nr:MULTISPECIES: mycothiol synthase [Frankia]Q2JFW4.1 RecName: Full=Mycothiol acetyltransferase; Short=MSH acetyltransferase; AltName: Full=Mycothiol synthase [Frankia casuarinae]ABD09828.1 GCN5-related N-acetyltransferase [Frankia casuarinae]EYT92284.1 acetyltransferase [Frankia casuarinae]KDA42454.1 acetyltransferase [Frankia sp. BMG5.23]KEZ38037.1 mycothiol synthase [Frankia sp. CeD]TFE35496.1 mycothiol synthase [Frankia sp. B2]